MRFELVPELHYRPRGNADATHDVADLVSLLRVPVARVWAVSHPHGRLWEIACSPPGGDCAEDVVEPALLAEFDLDFTAISANRDELGMDPGQHLDQRQRVLSVRRLDVHELLHHYLLVGPPASSATDTRTCVLSSRSERLVRLVRESPHAS